MLDLQLGDAQADGLGDPALAGEQFVRDRLAGRHPAVALAEQRQEERPAVLDFRQADRQDPSLGSVLVGDPPAEVHFTPGDTPLLAHPAQLREDTLDQLLALRLHVAEGRGDEHTHHGRLGRPAGLGSGLHVSFLPHPHDAIGPQGGPGAASTQLGGVPFSEIVTRGQRFYRACGRRRVSEMGDPDLRDEAASALGGIGDRGVTIYESRVTSVQSASSREVPPRMRQSIRPKRAAPG
jgi:hypothetical protein